MSDVRVLVVDDHTVFAEALALRLAQEPDFVVLPIACTAGQALAEVARSRPAVVVLDLILGKESGLAVLDQIDADYPDTKAIVLTAADAVDSVDTVEAVVDAVRRGARGWLPKSVGVDQVIRAIRDVAAGGASIPPMLLGGVLSRLARPNRTGCDPLSKLTAREREVLQCMVDGLPRPEIAKRLRLSSNTVRTHVQNLLVKLDSHSVLEAVAIAQQAGMRQSRRSFAGR